MDNTSPSVNPDKDPDPSSAVWLGILHAIYASIGIPANLLVLILSVSKNVRIYPINICIMSIAFSDMMVLVSFVSSTIWAFTYDIRVCKVLGVGIYVFVVMSMTLPACLSLCRHAALCDSRDTYPILRKLKNRKGILILNGMFWTYGLVFLLPFIITDKFGLDAMGCCGVAVIDSVFLWAYYLVAIMGPLFAGYAVTYIFYRKLSDWVQKTSSLMMTTSQTKETLILTRNIMRMIRWLLFVPFAFYYPAAVAQLTLRIFPGVMSVRTARYFLITVSFSHVIDPFVTLLFVNCYRKALVDMFQGKRIFLFSSNSVSVIPVSERHQFH